MPPSTVQQLRRRFLLAEQDQWPQLARQLQVLTRDAIQRLEDRSHAEQPDLHTETRKFEIACSKVRGRSLGAAANLLTGLPPLQPPLGLEFGFLRFDRPRRPSWKISATFGNNFGKNFGKNFVNFAQSLCLLQTVL